jgi:hypothetical protein
VHGIPPKFGSKGYHRAGNVGFEVRLRWHPITFNLNNITFKAQFNWFKTYLMYHEIQIGNPTFVQGYCWRTTRKIFSDGEPGSNIQLIHKNRSQPSFQASSSLTKQATTVKAGKD